MLIHSTLATALSFFGSAMAVPRDAVIFQPGEIADGVYIVRSGRIAVELPDTTGVPLRTEIIAEYGILGLPAAISRLPHCLRAVATDNSELIFLRSEELTKLIRTNAELGMEIVTALSAELHDLGITTTPRELAQE